MQSMTQVLSYVGDTIVKGSTGVLQPDDLQAKGSVDDHTATKVWDCKVITAKLLFNELHPHC